MDSFRTNTALTAQLRPRGALPTMGIYGLVLLAICSGGTAHGFAGKSADDWAKNWCQAMPGNSREQLLALMGPPTSAPPNQLAWVGQGVAYYAFLRPDGTAKQLDINTASMSDADKAALQCKPTRTQRAMALAAAEAAKTPHSSTPACKLVSAAEMSAIVGSNVRDASEEHPGSSTKCTYRTAAGLGPTVEFTVSWGEGRTAMAGMGMASSRERGLVDPYADLGDQAGSAGPLVLIRKGDDLVTLVLSGVSDKHAVAKKIFDTARPRM